MSSDPIEAVVLVSVKSLSCNLTEGGTKLLNFLLEWTAQSTEVKRIYLHVQVNNEEAIQFYKRHGFEITGTEVQYYKKILPADSYIVEKSL